MNQYKEQWDKCEIIKVLDKIQRAMSQHNTRPLQCFRCDNLGPILKVSYAKSSVIAENNRTKGQVLSSEIDAKQLGLEALNHETNRESNGQTCSPIVLYPVLNIILTLQ